MKVRRAHGEINPYHWHAPELLQKSTFLATKIQAEFTKRDRGSRTGGRQRYLADPRSEPSEGYLPHSGEAAGGRLVKDDCQPG